MADYYPLLARALDALPDRSPGLRRAVYDRARNALVSQLRSLEPPLSEDDIDLERRALDVAIERLEVEHGGIPAPANDAPSKVAVSSPPAPVAPPPVPAPPTRTEPPRQATPSQGTPVQEPSRPEPPRQEPARQEPARQEPPREKPVRQELARQEPERRDFAHTEPALPEPEPAKAEAGVPPAPELPRAPSPRFELRPEPVVSRPREAAIAITAPRTQAESETGLPGEPAPSPASAATDAVAPDEAADLATDGPQGRQRPRIDVVAPRRRSRILRNIAIFVVLAAVIGAIGVAAFLLRDTPPALVRTDPNGAPATAADGSADTKFGDRIGNESPAPQTAERPKPRTEATPAAPAAPAPEPKQSVGVAQSAVLIEESSAPDSNQPKTSPGRVIWRLETANGDQGQPLQTVAIAAVTYPDAGLSLTMTIRKNLDATLPASHTVSLAFSETGPDSANRVVQDVGLLQAKDDENSRGSPVSGLPVRVRDNLFLIGLSSLPSDVERNTDLLLRRTWFDIAVRYTSGRRAVLTFEKGQSGTQVLQDAFEAWK